MFKASLHNCTIDKLPKIAQLIVDTMQETNIKACFFSGNIGIGKTALIQSITQLLGVKNRVNSPSFNIMNEYETNNGVPIYHFDFYRITGVSEAIDMGVLEYLDNQKAYRFIEWSENIINLLISKYILIAIHGDKYNSRNYKIEEITNEL
ncbi:MAG: tRNA (adenosine(37)-N6)-threonylcarbamoyltransferase complex ATPase subunit type 1 TsaE [Solitalea-like symbiont of Acarus siro]